MNVHGLSDRNISYDLHLDRLTKDSILGFGFNITDKAVQQLVNSGSLSLEIILKKPVDAILGFGSDQPTP